MFPDAVQFQKLQKAVTDLGIRELRGFEPVEIFRGGSVAAGKYSILLRATLQSAERTLRDDEVARWSADIIRSLEGLGGVLRS